MAISLNIICQLVMTNIWKLGILTINKSLGLIIREVISNDKYNV